jgi:hypothetical protein
MTVYNSLVPVRGIAAAAVQAARRAKMSLDCIVFCSIRYNESGIWFK